MLASVVVKVDRPNLLLKVALTTPPGEKSTLKVALVSDPTVPSARVGEVDPMRL